LLRRGIGVGEGLDVEGGGMEAVMIGGGWVGVSKGELGKGGGWVIVVSIGCVR